MLSNDHRTGPADLVTEQVQRSPFFLVSLLVHLGLLFILSLVSLSDPQPEKMPPLLASAEMAPMDEPEPEEPEEKKPEVELPDEAEAEVVAPDPVDPQTPETPDDEDFEEAKGEPDNLSNEPFDGKQTSGTVGFGGGAGGPFGNRGRGGRRPRGGGGGGPTQEVVRRGLTWLADHQDPDGRWNADDYWKNGDAERGELCRDGRGLSGVDSGVTGLALLAFLGAGQTHREGEFKNNVKRGLRWLRDQQDAEGCFAPRGDTHHVTYNHAVAALAMTEAYGMTKAASWKETAKTGIRFLESMRNPYKAWRYGVRPGENDTSVTGWCVMALKSAQMSELEVNEGAYPEILAFVDEMTDPDTGRTGYQRRGERPVRAEGRIRAFPAAESESLTAVGILTRIFCGQNPNEEDVIAKGAELLAKRLPSWKESEAQRVDMYYWYYGTLAMFQIGGPRWRQWNERMKGAIVTTQRKDGNYQGSWDPIGPWGADGGRVYSTALLTMCLEVYYRYGRVFGTR